MRSDEFVRMSAPSKEGGRTDIRQDEERPDQTKSKPVGDLQKRREARSSSGHRPGERPEVRPEDHPDVSLLLVREAATSSRQGSIHRLDEDQAVLVVRARWVRGAWILTGRCPYCRMRHQHGGGAGPAPNLGLRVAHCTYPHRCATNGSYRLELEEAA
jgi:hypothetical protein